MQVKITENELVEIC